MKYTQESFARERTLYTIDFFGADETAQLTFWKGLPVEECLGVAASK